MIIDISYAQKNINWAKLKKNVSGVIIRSGLGLRGCEEDSMFKSHITNAIKYGMDIGIYFFSYAFTNDLALKEAQFVIEQLKPYREYITFPVFFDWEYDSMKYAKNRGYTPTRGQITEFNRIFCQEIEKAGFRAGVYFNYDYLKNHLDVDSLPYKKWIAYYSKVKQKKYDFQQYTDKGRVDGYNGNLDCDYKLKKEDAMGNIIWKGQLTKHFSQSEYMVGNTGDCPITREAYLQARMMEQFRKWLDRPIIVTSWYRSPALNKKVGGIATSNHLKGTATDWHTNIKINKKEFIKYAKKWRKICKAHGVQGEAGLYTWGVHFGSSVPKWVHWDSRSGKQIINPFKELL